MAFITSTPTDVYGAYGGLALDNQGRPRHRRKLRRRKKKLRREARRKAWKLLNVGTATKKGRVGTATKKAIQVQRHTPPTPHSLGPQRPHRRPQRKPHQPRPVGPNAAAGIELAGVTGFGVDPIAVLRQNMCALVNGTFGAITEEAYLEEYGSPLTKGVRRRQRLRTKAVKRSAKGAKKLKKGRKKRKAIRQKHRAARRAAIQSI